MSIGSSSVSSDGIAVVTAAPAADTPSSAAGSAVRVGPSPPKSAVSLQTAAAKPQLPAVSSIKTTSTPASQESPSGPSNLAKQPSKVKQRRKINPPSTNDEFIYKPGPSTAGGTIGAVPEHALGIPLPAAGGNRRAQPELVLPFQLPFTDIRPKLPVLDNASVQVAMSMGASETSSPDSASDSDDYSVLSDDSDDDSDDDELSRQARRRRKEPATIEESLVLLQSLRQSRLSHLSSLLTPFSQRVRSGMIYPNVLPLSLLHGLNPRDPHVLIQLGRADIHVGPHVFVRTKFWEVRPDYEMPSAMNQAARMRPTTFSNVQPYGHVPRPLPTPAAASQATAAKTSLPAVPGSTGSQAGTPNNRSAPPSSATVAVPVQVLPAAPSGVSRSTTSASSSAPSASSSLPAASKVPVSLPQPAKAGSATVALPRPPTVTPSLPRPPSISQSSSTSTPAASTPAAQPVTVTPQRPPQTAPNASGPASSTSTAPAAGASRPPPAPPAIDAVLVSRVNATAALNPDLQELLHVAASGKASPTQLKALGVWIQAITAQLRGDEARAAAAAKGGSSASGSTASSSFDKNRKNKADEAVKANKKQAKQDEREAKKRAKADAKAKANGSAYPRQTHQQHNNYPSGKLPHPPPGWPTDGPPKPPVIIVEFRENPSMRFILPLWKCLVERTEGMEREDAPKVKSERRGFFDNDSDDEEPKKLDPELKLSFFAPSLGSDAADGSGLRELEEELKRKAAEEAASNASMSPPSTAVSLKESSPAPAPQSQDTGAADGNASKRKDAALKKGGKPLRHRVPTNESADESLSRKHEIYPLTWSIKSGVSESLWEAFGRVPGTMTCQPVKREPEIELEPDVAEFLVPEIRYHLLDLPMEEIKIQKETAETFVDLYGQMPERHFILPRIAPTFLPPGLEDHMMDKFAVRSQAIQGRPIVKRKAGAREEEASFSYEGMGLTVLGSNGVKNESTGPPKPPKRKRHVATHNPDGSLKSCGACGKTKTPMWRRGPKGPSQLCNACGARWKAGRLVVPEVAPPAIIEPEEDKTEPRKKDSEDHQDEEKGKGSPHGSNALIVPQTSEMDDAGNYSLMTSSGANGNSGTVAATASPPYGESGGPYAFSESKDGLDFTSPHLSRGSASPSPFIRSPILEDELMPASVDPSMLSGSARVASRR